YSQNLNNHIFQLQGLSGVSKRDFFWLFWPAYLRAFSKHNVLSGWRKVGLLPFNPEEVLRQILKRLDIRKLHEVGDTSSRSLINSLLSQAFAGSDTTPESQRKISSVIHQLSTQNSILNAEISGLREAVGLEKKKRKRGKPLVDKLRDPESKSAFFAPARLAQALDMISSEDEDKRLAEAAKQALKRARDLAEQEKADAKKQAQIERQEAQ
ncbi:hypothetical protein K402DRAFT_306918, partial [Aulographum hederae CBS 113979]